MFLRSPIRHAHFFAFLSVFLTGLGLTIMSPVFPFLVQRSTQNAQTQAYALTGLTSIYAFAVFFSAPLLGKLSDQWGRRPILILSLLGSALSYLIMGLGGSLWVLFLGRLLEGATAGEISTLFAYFSDTTTEAERTKVFGWISAVAGIGTAIGPLLGGFFAQFGLEVPLYAGAVLTLSNALYGYFFLKESHVPTKKAPSTSRRKKKSAKTKLFLPTISRLLFIGFLLWLPNSSFQALFPQFSWDTFHWKPFIIGSTFSILGVLDLFSQLLLMPKLLHKFSDEQLLKISILLEILGYSLLALLPFFPHPVLFFSGLLLFGIGDALFGPIFNGCLSKATPAQAQGQIQGVSQSIQAISRMLGPLIGARFYEISQHSSLGFMGILLLLCALSICFLPALYRTTHV